MRFDVELKRLYQCAANFWVDAHLSVGKISEQKEFSRFNQASLGALPSF